METRNRGQVRSGESYITEYLHRKGFAGGAPIAGNFEITCRCNFNCKMCYVHQQHIDKSELTAQEWVQLGKEARDAGMLFLLLTGGEPFLRSDFPEIYLGLRRLGLIVSVNTNASLLTDEILAAFKASPPARVNVSLYGGSSDTYCKLCGNAAYDAVTGNILRMKAAGIHVKINATVNPYNAPDIDQIFGFGKSNDIAVRGTAYMYPPVRVHDAQECPRFTPKEAAACMLRFREHTLTQEQLRQMVTLPSDPEDDCAGEGGPMRCRAGRTSFWITWDGRILPCGMFPTVGHSVKEMGLIPAWELTKREVALIRLPAACSTCSKKERCGVCAASCLAENGDTSIRPEYICEMTDWLDQMIRDKYGQE